MEEITNSRKQIRQPIIITVAVAFGILIGATVLKPSPSSSEDLASSLAKFKEVLVSIDQNYVDEVDSEELVETSITEMLQGLDPHSNYIPRQEVDRINAQIQGSYDGIGIQFDILRDTIFVIKPLAGGPSLEQGLLPGDKIVEVEGENVAGVGISSKGVTDRLLGPAGSSVSIKVERDGDILAYTIRRGQIPQKSVETYYMVNNEIGYIKISRFGTNCYSEFQRAINSLNDQGMKKLVLDLLGNPGGLMSAAESISDELLSGERLIVSQKSAHSRYNSTFYANKKGSFEDGPVIVLVDEYSASASEIIAGALQDHDRALIVGRRTFGKGLVQLPVTLHDQSEIRLTIARYFTPTGRSIQKPYNNGENYHAEISSRYEAGEFFSADSISFEDSLTYVTTKGRTVYGGGGIMPDVFIPYDTSMNTGYYRQLLAKRAIREFSLKYYVKSDAIQEMELKTFLDDFEITNAMLDKIVEIGNDVGADYNAEDFEISKSLIKAYTKAEIGSIRWGEDAFFPIMNPVSNQIYIQALGQFDEAKRLAEAR